LKRAFKQKVESVPPCAADNDALAKLSEGQLPREVADPIKPNSPTEVSRRACTSAAMIGLAISMGASSLLLPQQGDEAMAAEPIATEPTVTTTAPLEVAVVSSSSKVEPEVAATAKQPATEAKQSKAEIEVNAVAKQVKTEREATEASKATTNHGQSQQNLWQATKPSKGEPDASVIAASNDLSPNPALLEGQVPTISPVNGIVHQAPSNNTANKLSKSYSYSVESLGQQSASESATLPSNINDLLKAKQDQALVRLKQQRNRLQTSLAELKSEESSKKAAQAKMSTSAVTAANQPSVVTDSVLEAQTPVVTQTDKVVSIPATLINPVPSSNAPLSATVPSSIVIPVPSPEKPVAATVVIEPKTATSVNLGTQPTQISTTSAKPELQKPILIEPKVMGAGTPAKVYQVKPGDTLDVIAENYGVSASELIRLNHIENPNLIQINQELKIPAAQPATLVPNLQPTTAVAKATSVKPQVIVPGLSQPAFAHSTAKQLLFSNKPIATPTTLVGTAVPSTQAVPVLVASEPVTSAATKQVSQDNPYVEKLRGEILKLRQQYQSQREGRPLSVQVPATPAAVSIPVTAPLTSTKPEQQARPSAARVQAKLRLQAPSAAIAIPVPPPLTNSTASREINPEFNPNQYDQALRAEQNRAAAKRSAQQQLVAATPSNPNSYNPMIQAPIGETVTPQLPPIQGPNPYLPQSPQFQGYIWPTKGTLTSGFGKRWGRMHKGIDIAAPIGTPVVAAAPGVVVSSGWNSGGYGNLVEIQHPDGSLTRYAHNSRLLVRAGQVVEQGQEISEMGSTGFSTGPHCHFEVHPAGQGAVNPIAFLPRR